MFAVWKGQNEIVSFLIDQGAEMDVIDTTHAKNLVHLVIEEGHVSTLKLLFEKGAKSLINNGDKDYRTPLHYASQVGNIEVSTLFVRSFVLIANCLFGV